MLNIRKVDAIPIEVRLLMTRIHSAHYGKGNIRLTKVIRGDPQHQLLEYCVQILLEGDFLAAYTDGHNQKVIPTDTMKNTVYALARQETFQSPEEFAQLIVRHFLNTYAHVTTVTVRIQAAEWERIQVDDTPHPHAFRKRSEQRTAEAYGDRVRPVRLQGGVSGLSVLKTTASEFSNFHRDAWTTLQDTSDRIFATEITCCWHFTASSSDFNAIFKRAIGTILETFAEHYSLSVQQTLYAIADKALASIPELDTISLSMPNQHRILADLTRLGLENPNEIFVATSEPFGLIQATVGRN
jgi:urate oxidase